MDKEQIMQIKNIAENQLENLSDDDKGAAYYLKEIVESAETLLYSGY